MNSNDAETDYAFWTFPDQPFTVTYSLEQFHEIDFQVNEGYRRIPHGGIEIGGLLFGVSEPAGVRVKAFRLIDCEHATGPSFALSERDLDQLQKQIDNSTSDADLQGLEIIGWFIAHTRTPLQLNSREVAIFERFFPKRKQITLLVKPERFQPTRFAFFGRKEDGSLDQDATGRAVILPLPGRTSRGTDGPIASIPAPTQKPSEPSYVPSPPADKPTIPAEAAIPGSLSNRKLETENSAASAKTPAPTSPAAQPTPAGRHGVTRLRVTSAQSGIPEGVPEPSIKEVETSLATVPKESVLPSLGEIRRRRTGVEPRKTAKATGRPGLAYSVRLVLVLLVAAVLGCAVGYLAYRELPAPIVPLAVRAEGSGLVVTWPVEQTRQTSYAAIRVNDGAQQPLSAAEKVAGAARIAPNSAANVKIELIVQHWMRDSRGIVRYVSPASATRTPPGQ